MNGILPIFVPRPESNNLSHKMELPLLALDADFAHAANVASACPGYIEFSAETGKFHCLSLFPTRCRSLS
jgi:hypothetical protein